MVFVPMAQSRPKAGAKDLLYSLKLSHEFTSLFSPKVIDFAGSLRKVFPQNLNWGPKDKVRPAGGILHCFLRSKLRARIHLEPLRSRTFLRR